MSTLKTGSRTSHPHEPLASEGLGYGWVACTTDDILTIKDNLYDTLVTIPPAYSKDASQKVWPRIQGKRAVDIKATQRDARRYQTLRRDLRRLFPKSHPSAVRKEPTPNFTPAYPASGEVAKDNNSNDGGGEDAERDTQPLFPFPRLENDVETFDDASSTTDDRLLEPQSWSALAYDSFMWWASAGERRADMEEEADFDSSLLANADNHTNGDGGGSSSNRSPGRPRSTTSAKQLSSPGRQRQRRRSSTMMEGGGEEEGGSARVGGLEMQLIGYFHHLTALIVQTLAKVVDDATTGGGGEEEEGERGSDNEGDGNGQEEEEVVFVSSEDMGRMGLDAWSEGDRRFVVEMVEFYWGRRCQVRGARVECCGVRIC
ncbi:MAG: hypothetical protein Q9214_000524 [Letrouitia sp. 1 TL-2023]